MFTKKNRLNDIEGGGNGVLAQYLEQTVSWEKLGTVIYIGRYVCMFNVHIDRLPGPLATMISPPSSVTPPSPLLPHRLQSL